MELGAAEAGVHMQHARCMQGGHGTGMNENEKK
jgi:hypothetical protein